VSLVASVTKHVFLCTNSQFFSGFATAQAASPLPLCKDFHAKSNDTNAQDSQKQALKAQSF
jgi:hypothetical protein